MIDKPNDEMSRVLNLYKKKSETPLQTIERFVALHPEYKKVKMTYAGRLDPMAEGVLVVLSGEKNKERAAYTALDKDYEFEFILGIETDTYDILGKITNTKETKPISEKTEKSEKETEKKEIKKALKKYSGKFMQKYPAYSSKVVDGTPLFDLARKGKLGNMVMPEHEVEVMKMEFLGSKEIKRQDFKKQIETDINAVSGDFRQMEILKLWKKYFESKTPENLVIYKAKVSCGSGFYVRQFVSDIGRDLGTGAATTHILRTRVGKYHIK